MDTNLILDIFLILAGAYTFFGGAANWEWFMSRPRAARTIAMIGRPWTRVLYIVIGSGLLALGVLSLAGVITP